ncbi:MAG: hypothetical protein ACI93S_001707 [Ancylomarina sp.]|jgi:hypothetical protein
MGLYFQKQFLLSIFGYYILIILFMKKDNRRKFIQKLGVTVGAATLLDSEAMASVGNMETSKDIERSKFLSNYENWVNQYIDVVEKEKSDKNNMANKHRIMELSHQAKDWQEKIAIYLNDDTFKQRYIQLSMRLSDSITNELEA